MDANEEQSAPPPADLRSRAHVAGNGELLWPLTSAVAAARWVAGRGYGIWGGEVYAPRGPFTAMMIREWRTEPEWRPGEEWNGFVERALAQTLAALEAESSTRHEGLLYFLAYAPEATFEAESRRTRGAPGERWLEISTQEAQFDG